MADHQDCEIFIDEQKLYNTNKIFISVSIRLFLSVCKQRLTNFYETYF